MCLHAVPNAFTRGGECVYTRRRTRSHGEANTCIGRRTRLHEEANVFTRSGERVYRSMRTHLHEEANAFALYLASERYCSYIPL